MPEAPKKTLAEQAQSLADADRAYMDGIGGSMHTVAHPFRYGWRNARVAVYCIFGYGFCALANNLVRLSVAAQIRKTTIAKGITALEASRGRPVS
jgi:hypothetical protein